MRVTWTQFKKICFSICSLLGKHYELYFLALWCPGDAPHLRLWGCNKGETHFSKFWVFRSRSPGTIHPGVLFGVCPDGNGHLPRAGLKQRVVQHAARALKPSPLPPPAASSSTCVQALCDTRVAGSVEASYKITVPLNNCTSSIRIYVTAFLRGRLHYLLSKRNWLEAK